MVGLVTIGLIVLLKRTRLGSFGIVVAVVAGSGLAALFTLVFDLPVAIVDDVADDPHGSSGARHPVVRERRLR